MYHFPYVLQLRRESSSASAPDRTFPVEAGALFFCIEGAVVCVLQDGDPAAFAVLGIADLQQFAFALPVRIIKAVLWMLRILFDPVRSHRTLSNLVIFCRIP